MKKFAIIGANSTGKSTASHYITAKLRAEGILCERTTESARVLSFNRALLDTEIASQYWVFGKGMMEESLAKCRGDVDVLICDHTPYDYFIFARTEFPKLHETPVFDAVKELSKKWLGTYKGVFVFSTIGTKYHTDSVRKEKKEGMKLRNRVNNLLAEDISNGVIPNCNVVTVPVEERGEFVLQEIKNILRNPI